MPKFSAKVPELSFHGILDANGFESMVSTVSGHATLNTSIKTSNEITFRIYVVPDIFDSTGTTKTLFYQKVIPTGNFVNKFNIKYNRVIYEIVNATASNTISMETRIDKQNQFNSQTFLNSPLTKVANADCVFNSNSFHIDLIRNIYENFKKVNVLGINSDATNGTNDYTLGISLAGTGTYQRIHSVVQTGVALSIQCVSADDVNNGTIGAIPPYSDATNIGARKFQMIYIDELGVRQSVEILAGTGVIGVSALCVERLILTDSGSSNTNVGDVFVFNGTNIFAQMKAGEGSSATAIYRVPADRQAVMRELNLSGYSNGDMVKVILNTNGSNKIVGKFLVNTTGTSLVYNLDGLLTAGETVMVEIDPSSSSGADTLINVNINVYETPLNNTF
tara:strand:+ start:114 stop:1289 length:1176 start_codon:yes stop_codon:yes gene_type:complete